MAGGGRELDGRRVGPLEAVVLVRHVVAQQEAHHQRLAHLRVAQQQRVHLPVRQLLEADLVLVALADRGNRVRLERVVVHHQPQRALVVGARLARLEGDGEGGRLLGRDLEGLAAADERVGAAVVLHQLQVPRRRQHAVVLDHDVEAGAAALGGARELDGRPALRVQPRVLQRERRQRALAAQLAAKGARRRVLAVVHHRLEGGGELLDGGGRELEARVAVLGGRDDQLRRLHRDGEGQVGGEGALRLDGEAHGAGDLEGVGELEVGGGGVGLLAVQVGDHAAEGKQPLRQPKLAVPRVEGVQRRHDQHLLEDGVDRVGDDAGHAGLADDLVGHALGVVRRVLAADLDAQDLAVRLVAGGDEVDGHLLALAGADGALGGRDLVGAKGGRLGRRRLGLAALATLGILALARRRPLDGRLGARLGAGGEERHEVPLEGELAQVGDLKDARARGDLELDRPKVEAARRREAVA